jgi:hypothetical protein
MSLLLFLIVLVGCTSSRPPGTFADAGYFHANTLELRPDGTV